MSFCLGRVKAQLSQGEALFLSTSLYVRRKLKSPFITEDPCLVGILGLSGGVAIAFLGGCFRGDSILLLDAIDLSIVSD